MRNKTITKTLYKFDELDEHAQEHALEKVYDINVDHEWWDCTYEDAATIGLKLKYFDLDRNRNCTGAFTESPLTVIRLIEENHGKDCETYKTAQHFKQSFLDFEKQKQFDEEHQDEDDFDYTFDEIEFDEVRDEFQGALLEDYSIMLQHEYEYLTSREAIIETIEANEYEFDERGNLA